jgi:hypothetical protein
MDDHETGLVKQIVHYRTLFAPYIVLLQAVVGPLALIFVTIRLGRCGRVSLVLLFDRLSGRSSGNGDWG